MLLSSFSFIGSVIRMSIAGTDCWIDDDGSVKFNQKFLDSFKKSENLKMLNLKLERANRRYKDEVNYMILLLLLDYYEIVIILNKLD